MYNLEVPIICEGSEGKQGSECNIFLVLNVCLEILSTVSTIMAKGAIKNIIFPNFSCVTANLILRSFLLIRYLEVYSLPVKLHSYPFTLFAKRSLCWFLWSTKEEILNLEITSRKYVQHWRSHYPWREWRETRLLM